MWQIHILCDSSPVEMTKRWENGDMTRTRRGFKYWASYLILFAAGVALTGVILSFVLSHT
jgi:hypothetical protein